MSQDKHVKPRILLEDMNGYMVLFSRNVKAKYIKPIESTNIMIGEYKLKYESTKKRDEIFINIFKGL